MTKYAQIVMGPAGTGKVGGLGKQFPHTPSPRANLHLMLTGHTQSTYCKLIQEHCQNLGRAVHVVNLDPAAEEFGYEVSFGGWAAGLLRGLAARHPSPPPPDVRDLISVQDVMEELEYGPNGGLIFCMEYLLDNMEWLDEALDSFGDDDYLLLDCPGQIELYSHLPIMKTVAKHLADRDFRVVGVYLMDALFVTDAAKLLAGNLAALSAMVAMETPHINVRGTGVPHCASWARVTPPPLRRFSPSATWCSPTCPPCSCLQARSWRGHCLTGRLPSMPG